MSNELHAVVTSGLTLYAVLIDSTGRAWNGSAFETISGAHWTNYDLALTEAAGGIYLANMPATVAGAYSYAVYEQAGASPATTDALRGIGSLAWDGAAEMLAPSAAAIRAEMDAHSTQLAAIVEDTGTTLPAAIAAIDVTVALSSAEAEDVASGRLAIRSYHSFSQAITSTSTAALNTATKVWLAIKSDPDDPDAESLVFVEKTAGLTVLAGAAYGTAAHGSLVIGGTSGAWTITAALDEAATGLLHSYATSGLYAELKAKVGNDTVPVWDGKASISKGIVRTVS